MEFLLKNYNERQREAVTHGDGPLLVISGAGTGKTNLIVGRILYLLLEKKVPPEEILALTFTEKATQEMIERVDVALPLGYGEIWIKTFHSFCDSILKEKAFEIGLSTDFKLLGEADLWMFLKRHVFDFDLKYYRSLNNPQKFLGAMQQHFGRLKDEDITPEQYIEYASSALKEAANDEDRERAAKHLELANAYKKYEELLVENNYTDFGGLLAQTLRLLESRPSVLGDLQKRFKYILVDEFQDTNFAQNKIVTLLAEKHRNLLVVGDDDQSIYKWRGASLTNITYFQNLFPEAKKIVLNENYRSSQPILDLSYSVIQKNNPNRLEVKESIDKRLIAASKTKGKMPSVHHFESLDQEVDFVVDSAVKSLKSGKDTAILVRTNALATPFLDKLKQIAAPFQHFASPALFTKAGVKDCMAVLRVLVDPWDDLAVFRLLSMACWNIPMERILEITHKAKFGTRSLFDSLNAEEFAIVKKLLDELIEFSREHAASEVIGRFLDKSGYLKEASAKAIESISDIAAFSDKVREFENIHPNKQVSDFLAYIQLLEESGERAQNGEQLDPSAIKILTIHSAKGLEFDSVFLPGLAQWKFPSVSRRDPFEVPEELIKEALPTGDHHLEEERRLFYVACTRAKSELVLSYSDFYDGKRKWKPSIFIAEVLESGKALSDSKRIKLGSSQTEMSLEKNTSKAVAKFALPKLSYTQIETFETCPLKYQFRHLFKVPVPMPGVVNFGQSIHKTLHKFYLELKRNSKTVSEGGFELLSKIFEENWIPEGYETPALRADQKKRGLEMLRNFYKKESETSQIPEFLEKDFTLKIKDVVVTGRIDRIDKLEDGTFEVIDYKTGGSTEKKLDKNMQLSIYALACRDVLKIPVSKLSIYFLEETEKVSTTRTDVQLEACQDEILEWAEKISKSDFSPTPGFHCGYCDYRLICPAAAAISR